MSDVHGTTLAIMGGVLITIGLMSIISPAFVWKSRRDSANASGCEPAKEMSPATVRSIQRQGWITLILGLGSLIFGISTL